MAGVGGAGSRLLSDGCLLSACISSHAYMFLSTAVHTYMLPFANQSRTYMQHCSEQEKQNGAPGFKCDQMWMCLENRKHTVYTKPGEKKGLVVYQYVGLFQMPL